MTSVLHLGINDADNCSLDQPVAAVEYSQFPNSNHAPPLPKPPTPVSPRCYASDAGEINRCVLDAEEIADHFCSGVGANGGRAES